MASISHRTICQVDGGRVPTLNRSSRLPDYPLAVVAILGVEAGFGNHQSFNRLSLHDVRVDDFVHIGERDPAVPDGIGIHHQVRTMLALVKAAGLIGPHFSFQSAG